MAQNNQKAYIYIRYQKDYLIYVRLGFSLNLIKTDAAFSSNEVERGKFIRIFEVEPRIVEETMSILDDELYRYEDNKGHYPPLYYMSIVRLIEDVFNRYEIKYRKFDDKELYELKKKVDTYDLLRQKEFEENIKLARALQKK